jgi:hypothetical protein
MSLPELITEAAEAEPERDAALSQTIAARDRLMARAGFHVEPSASVATVAWTRDHGHAWDQFGEVYRVDDLPLWALDGFVPDTAFQLFAEQCDDGAVYVLDAPRHSWARTVRRPSVPWPDLAKAQATLNQHESGGCRWVTRPEARSVGFVCQLASVDDHGTPAPSRQSLVTVDAVIREALRANG